jgi:CRP-like cAMP-binding protein
MIDPEIQKSLRGHPLLQGLSESHVVKLATCARQMTVTAGQYLGREKEAADGFYLIQSGQVAIEICTPDRGTVCIQTLGPGDLVGWSWLAPPHVWQFDARVTAKVEVLALDAASLRKHCEQDHDLGYELLKRLVVVIARRLAATRMQLLDFYR